MILEVAPGLFSTLARSPEQSDIEAQAIGPRLVKDGQD